MRTVSVMQHDNTVCKTVQYFVGTTHATLNVLRLVSIDLL